MIFRVNTHTSAEDRVILIQQNARQILKVVKETFTGYLFDGQVVVSDCSLEKSDGEILVCMWSQVVYTLDSKNRVNVAGKLGALTKVRPSTKQHSALRLTKPSSRKVPKRS